MLRCDPAATGSSHHRVVLRPFRRSAPSWLLATRVMSITITAYNNGKYIGQMTVPLSGMAQSVEFPTSWGPITEMQIQTDEPGDVVLLDLSVYYLGG